MNTKSKLITWRKALITLAILIGATMVVILPGVFWELHQANVAFRSFSEALISGQYERAYDFAAPELRSTTDYASFVKVHESLNTRMGSLEHVETSHSEVQDKTDGWYATIDAQLVFVRGSLPFVFVLRKHNHSWEIYSYHER